MCTFLLTQNPPNVLIQTPLFVHHFWIDVLEQTKEKKVLKLEQPGYTEDIWILNSEITVFSNTVFSNETLK